MGILGFLASCCRKLFINKLTLSIDGGEMIFLEGLRLSVRGYCICFF